MSVPQVQRDELPPRDIPPLVEPALPRPWVTYGFVVLFALIYLAQTQFPVGSAGSFFDPSLQTLIAWGGMSQGLVSERGEWFRLLTAAFLHGGIAHLGMNSLAMVIAGATLEPFIGRLWFAALFFLGALGGGLASITFNPPNIVGVGASGAIMALFGFFLTIAFRFEKGPVRRAFVTNSMGALIPSLAPALLPLFGASIGFQIDYAAHGGGALAGAGVGLLLVFIWKRWERYPPARWFAAAVIVASLAVLAWGVKELSDDFAEQRFAAALMPDSEQPRTNEEARARADAIIRRYPNDPRGYFYKMLATRDDAVAEANVRKAVALAERYPNVFRERFRLQLRMSHALALKQLNRAEEGRKVAIPVCMAQGMDEFRIPLSREGLCR